MQTFSTRPKTFKPVNKPTWVISAELISMSNVIFFAVKYLDKTPRLELQSFLLSWITLCSVMEAEKKISDQQRVNVNMKVIKSCKNKYENIGLIRREILKDCSKSFINPSYTLLSPLCGYLIYKWTQLNPQCKQNFFQDLVII